MGETAETIGQLITTKIPNDSQVHEVYQTHPDEKLPEMYLNRNDNLSANFGTVSEQKKQNESMFKDLSNFSESEAKLALEMKTQAPKPEVNDFPAY